MLFHNMPHISPFWLDSLQAKPTTLHRICKSCFTNAVLTIPTVFFCFCWKWYSIFQMLPHKDILTSHPFASEICKKWRRKKENWPVVPCKGSWFAQAAICRRPCSLLYPSHPQPDPWTPTDTAVSFSLKFAKEPKSRLMASINSPLKKKKAQKHHWISSI